MKTKKIQRLFEYFLIFLFSTIIFAPIIYKFVLQTPVSDFPVHTKWAQDILQNPPLVQATILAHSGWQVLVILCHIVFSTSWGISAFLVTLFSILSTTFILYWIFRRKIGPWPSSILAIGLNIAGPLAFLVLKDSQFYFGYIWFSVYHNPTYLLLKPFAILTFYFSIEALENKKASVLKITLVALLSLFGTFAKPSYIICLLPSLAIVALIKFIRKQTINWKYLFFGIIIPQLLLLLGQFWLTYSGVASDSSHIIFAPFAVMNNFSNNLLEKFILSILFPLIVTAFYWKEAINDMKMKTAWLSFGFGAFVTYFLAESGKRLTDGNFLWSGEITIFILYFSCVVFLLENGFKQENQTKKWIIIILGSLCLFFGGIYYFLLMMNY